MRSACTTTTERTPSIRSVANLADSPSNASSSRATTLAAPVNPDDSRRPFEGAEHEHDPAVLAEMGDRLDTTAGSVQVPDALRVDHGELAIVALWRAVHEPVARERCRSDEEHRLGQQEARETIVDRGISPTHLRDRTTCNGASKAMAG